MAQNDIQITTTPPLAGVTLVQGVNGALQSLATDFAGSIDPAAIGGVGPYCTWADTANGLLKRRNAAGTAWIVEGTLFKASLPQYAEVDIPASDKGPIYVIGKGPYEWDGAAYAPSTRLGAADVSYDNTSSGLTADNAQAAVDELSTANNVGTKKALNAAGDAPIYACRAWVNFDGTTTPPTISASGNVSSVSRYSVGSFGANLILPMSNKNYMFTGSARVDNLVPSLSDVIEVDYVNSSPSLVTFITGFYTNAGAAALRNCQTVMIAVFGGIA